jgi:hypothetical protein
MCENKTRKNTPFCNKSFFILATKKTKSLIFKNNQRKKDTTNPESNFSLEIKRIKR